MSNSKQIVVVVCIIAFIMVLGATQINNFPPLEETLGETLIDRRGRDSTVSEVLSKDYVLLYFSASWCPPCRKFTPELVNYYDENADDDRFEVIFVSADKSKSDMKKYMKEYRMPWLAVPFGEYNVRNKLRTLYGGPGGIPNLVILDSRGRMLASSYDGRTYIGPQQVLAKLDGM